MKRLLFVFLALALAACSAGSQTEIERSQQKWQEANVSHYRFNLFVGCFCIFTQDMPLVIEVQNGEVVSMEYQNGNEIDSTSRGYFQRYATIDKIFGELTKDINGEADQVTVTYDANYGFAAQADIDFIKEAVDDEISLTLSNFEKLP